MRRAFCLLAVLLAGCTAPGGGAPSNRPDASEPRSAVPTEPAVLAEADCQEPKVRVQVIEVAKSGPESMTVKFRFVNTDRAAPVTIGDAFADRTPGTSSLSGVYVVDAAGQKKVFVLRDESGQPQCSASLGVLAPGGHVDGWARYPLPTPGAARVTVQVPGLSPFRDLPVSDQPGGTGATRPSY